MYESIWSKAVVPWWHLALYAVVSTLGGLMPFVMAGVRP